MKSKTSSLYPITRFDVTLAALLGAGSLVLYIRTLAPGLLYGDSGELQTVVYSLGMTHPTGYPVYVLLGRLFTLLPIGNLAWRVNLFSAVLGGLTVACVYLIVRILAGCRLAAISSAVTLAITPLFWYFSIITELYVPACAFLSGVLLFLLLWRQKNDRRWLAASALLGGLSLGVHSSVALAAPSVLLYLAVCTRQRKDWAWATSGALLGVLLALASFLILDAQNPGAGYYHATVEPSLSVWGMTSADLDSPLERLSFLYSARQFKYAMFADPADTMPLIGSIYWQVLRMVFAPLSLILLAIGFLGSYLSRWREGLLLLFGWGIQMFFITNYDIYDVVVFFVPTFIFLSVWIGIGLGTLMQALARVMRRFKWRKASLPSAALLGVAILGMTIHFWSGMTLDAWKAHSVTFMRGTDFEEYPFPLDDPQAPEEEARAIVAAVEENAIVFLGWDLLFPCYFVDYIEEDRNGLDFYEAYPQEGVTELADSAIAYIQANLETRPVYFYERPDGAALRHFEFSLVNRNGLHLFQVERVQP